MSRNRLAPTPATFFRSASDKTKPIKLKAPALAQVQSDKGTAGNLEILKAGSVVDESKMNILNNLFNVDTLREEFPLLQPISYSRSAHELFHFRNPAAKPVVRSASEFAFSRLGSSKS